MPGVPEAEALAKFKKAYPSAAGMGNGFPAFGADAVRFTLATYPPSNKRIALAPKRIEGNRHFLNKILERHAPRARPARRLLVAQTTLPAPAGLLQPLDPLALRRGVRAPRTTGSTRSASTRRRTPRTASSGTTSATGTSSSPSRSCASSPTAPSCTRRPCPRRGRRSRTCSRAACASCTP